MSDKYVQAKFASESATQTIHIDVGCARFREKHDSEAAQSIDEVVIGHRSYIISLRSTVLEHKISFDEAVKLSYDLGWAFAKVRPGNRARSTVRL